jgi:hypothetical protein
MLGWATGAWASKDPETRSRVNNKREEIDMKVKTKLKAGPRDCGGGPPPPPPPRGGGPAIV